MARPGTPYAEITCIELYPRAVPPYALRNTRCRLLFCLSQLHYDRPDVLKTVFPEYVPAPDDRGLEVRPDPNRPFPSSLYFQIAG